MNKWMKIAGSVLAFVMVATVVFYFVAVPTEAKVAQITLDAPKQVKNGEQFVLSVIVDSKSALASIDARITYDPEVVTFVGDEAGLMTGSDGIVNLKEIYEEETYQKTYQLTFEANAVGECSFAFDKTYITDYAKLEEVEIQSNADTVSVAENNRISDNTALAEILVATGELSPVFDKAVTEYTVHVDQSEDTFIFSSTPEDEEASVSVDMPDTLSIGENRVVITVTAPSGAVRDYVITVYRGE